MKKFRLIIVFLVACLLLVPGAYAKGFANGADESYHGQQFAERTCFAGEGEVGGQYTGTCQVIENGVPLEISGTVAEVCTEGQGLKIDTGDAVVTVYGIGPARYWTEQGVDRPTVGEEIIINAVEVTFSDGSTKIVAIEIQVSGETIALRDDSGLPLWRGGYAHRFQNREGLE